jgi:hypothetical protein
MAELVGDSENGVGIQAHSTSNHGVFSRSEAANGVVGHSNGDPAGGNAGVFGEHLANGTGVKGVSQGGIGVSGRSQSSNGVFAESETGIGVFSRGGRLAAQAFESSRVLVAVGRPPPGAFSPSHT